MKNIIIYIIAFYLLFRITGIVIDKGLEGMEIPKTTKGNVKHEQAGQAS